VAGGRNELAAYVRSTRPSLRVVFRATPAANGTYTVGADGTPFQVAEQAVALDFDPVHGGRSAPVVFQTTNDLPDAIGLHAVKLDWYVREQPAPSPCPPAGTSTHRIATSWRAFVAPPAGETGLPAWVYRPLMEWTCQWAAGLDDELAICNAIIANVGSSGLQYGVLGVYQVRDLLLNQGGMCGAWYQTLQHMAHCQGVFVYRRRYLVDRRPMPHHEEHWCAIVIRAGGLNRADPNVPPMGFRDNHAGFPVPPGGVPIVHANERRWRFWCIPGYISDGHCINFLVHDGGLYLYDACFGLGPIQVNAPLPVNNTNVAQGGADLAPFRAAYLDTAIDYMLGSIWNGADFLQTTFPVPDINGMTVRTADIPEVVNGNPGLTFRWGN
jgi:hypothetical protein